MALNNALIQVQHDCYVLIGSSMQYLCSPDYIFFLMVLGWMEPLRDPDGIEAARRAAEETGRAMKEKADQVKTAETCGQIALNIALVIFALPLRFAMKLIPWYRRSRAFAKVQITHLLHGDSAYACRFRLTGINVLVICSFIFLFIENVKLAFIPARWDHEIAIIGV